MSEAADEHTFERPRILTFFIQPEILLTWIVYSLLLFGLIEVGQIGYLQPLAMIWAVIFGLPLLHYGFTIIEQTARGIQRMPSINVDFFRDTRVYKCFLLVAFILTFLKFTPELLHGGIFAVLLFVTPAITAFVTLEHSIIHAINPVYIYHFISNMGFGYVALRTLTTSFLLTMMYFVEHRTTILETPMGTLCYSAAGIYLLLVMFRCTGVLLHTRRTELGFRTYFSEELAEDGQRARDRRERLVFLGDLRELCRQGQLDEAFSRLQAQLQKHRYAQEHLYYEDLREWEDPRLRYEVAKGFIKRLTEESIEQAWRIFADLHEETRGSIRLDSGAAIIRLAETAADSSQKRAILGSLVTFKDDFPDHPRLREACLIATELACELGDFPLAKTCFREVTSRRGVIHKPTYDRCRELLSRLDDDSNQSG